MLGNTASIAMMMAQARQQYPGKAVRPVPVGTDSDDSGVAVKIDNAGQGNYFLTFGYVFADGLVLRLSSHETPFLLKD